MFSWICPQCGREVPPSKTDCPYCAQRAEEAAQPDAAVAAAPVATAAQPYVPPQAPPPPSPPVQQDAPPQHHMPPPYAQQAAPPWQPQRARSGPPTWLMVVGFALLFLLIGGGLYYGLQRFGRSNPAERAGLENPSNASQQKVSNPLQKYIEVVGLRMLTENRKPVARFVVVNHSSTEITDLAANVTLWASTSRSEEDSVGSFNFKIADIGPNASKELTAPLKTKLKPYQLPDWQNATAEIQITSP